MKAGALDALPQPDAFAKRYRAGEPQVVYTRLVADLETPVSAYLKLAAKGPMSFLLESVEGGATRGRYSVIGLAPDLVWRADGDARRSIARRPRSRSVQARRQADAGVAARAAVRLAFRLPADLPPMAAGVFGYMGYDTIRLVERLPEMSSRTLRRAGRGADPPDAR